MHPKLSDNKDADVTLALHSFREGDHVKAFITSIDHGKKRISFGLKPSYFGDNEDSDSDAGSSGGEAKPGVLRVFATDDENAKMSDVQVEELKSSEEEDEEDE